MVKVVEDVPADPGTEAGALEYLQDGFPGDVLRVAVEDRELLVGEPGLLREPGGDPGVLVEGVDQVGVQLGLPRGVLRHRRIHEGGGVDGRGVLELERVRDGVQVLQARMQELGAGDGHQRGAD